nr:flavonol 3-sulfotransferase-like [Ipomoea batatas]
MQPYEEENMEDMKNKMLARIEELKQEMANIREGWKQESRQRTPSLGQETQASIRTLEDQMAQVAKCGNEEEDTHDNTFEPTRGSEYENVEEKESVEGKENNMTSENNCIIEDVDNEVNFFNPCDFNDNDSFDFPDDDDEKCVDTCENNSFNSMENNSTESCVDNFSNSYDSNSSNPCENNSFVSLDDNDGLESFTFGDESLSNELVNDLHEILDDDEMNVDASLLELNDVEFVTYHDNCLEDALYIHDLIGKDRSEGVEKENVKEEVEDKKKTSNESVREEVKEKAQRCYHEYLLLHFPLLPLEPFDLPSGWSSMDSLDDLETMEGIGDFECMKGSAHLECMGHISHFEGIVSIEFVRNLQQHFKPHPNDVLLASYPKSGTTWLKALVFSVVNRAKYNDGIMQHPLLTSNPHDLVPHLDVYATENPTNPRPAESPLIHTHIPYQSFPHQHIHTSSSSCRIVYVFRDPKDVLVSLWHFTSKLTPKHISPISLQEAFHRFSRGVSPFGPYWDHVAAYYNVSVQFPDKVLFLRYEDLKTYTVVHVKKLAAFLGQPFSEEEENEGAVQKIIDLCSFEKLRNLEVNKDGLQHVTMSEEIVIRHSTYFRRGEVGDWKTHLTQEMKEVLDQITEEKFKELGLKPFQHPDKTTA